MTIFDGASLHNAVVTALQEANVPEDHKNAFAVVATRAGVKGVLSTKIGDKWEVDTMISLDSAKHVETGVAVKATW